MPLEGRPVWEKNCAQGLEYRPVAEGLSALLKTKGLVLPIIMD